MGRRQQRQQQHQKKFSEKSKGEEKGQRRGPRLPASLRRELDLQNPHLQNEEEEEEGGGGGGGRPALPPDIYEYEENQAPEDSHKNRRFDDVDRLEYELPSDFEDVEIDEGAAEGEELAGQTKSRHSGRKANKQSGSGRRNQVTKLQSNEEEEDSDEEVSSDIQDDLDTYKHGRGVNEGADEDEEEDKDVDDDNDEDHGNDKDEQVQGEEEYSFMQHEESENETDDDDVDHDRHQRMIKAVRKARTKELREKKPKHTELLSEAFPESEFNINPPTDANNMQRITVEDLMTPLQSTTGFGSLRKRMQQLEKRGVAVDTPLPKAVRERLSRQVGYEKTNEEISKWQEIVKKNREAPNLVFTQRPDLTDVSTAELVSKFEPTTDLEKEVASLLQESGLADGTSEAGTTLGFNKLTMGEFKERQGRLAKMRSVLFYHEAKAKRVKKIKSKTFHRLLQKNHKGKVGFNGTEDEFDPEAIKEAALKAEFKRAQERMTLKHKNTSKWAKRIIQRGLKVKDDGTREAIAEQLRTHTSLTRKIHSADNASSSDDSSDEAGTDSGAEDMDEGLFSITKPREKLLAKAKVETLKVLEGDAEAEIPTSGLFSLPFMTRAIEKKRKQAQNEAIAVLEQLEQLEYNEDGVDGFTFEDKKVLEVAGASAGRLAFGAMAKLMPHGKEEEPDMLVEEGSSSDEDGFQGKYVVPVVGNTSAISKKRKADSNGSVEKVGNGATLLLSEASQAHKFQVTRESSSPLKESEAGGSKDVLANPWLFGEVNERILAHERVGGLRYDIEKSPSENPGPLVTSACVETVTVAGGTISRKRGRSDKKVEAVQNGGSLDSAPSEQPEKLRSFSSSEGDEKLENGEEVEQQFRLLTGNASQAELIQRAFAGDNVEADFEQLKDQALSEEVPMGEAALNLPGWGQWTDVQKKKGPPLWMLKQQEELKSRRDQALRKRKDFKLKHVIISEKMDKKAEKFLAPSLPFPYRSREVFERSIRMPLGREFNTDQAFRDMIRPAVVKDAGVIIDPIKYKMSEAKAGEAASVPQEKRKSGKKGSGLKNKRSRVDRPRSEKVAA